MRSTAQLCYGRLRWTRAHAPTGPCSIFPARRSVPSRRRVRCRWTPSSSISRTRWRPMPRKKPAPLRATRSTRADTASARGSCGSTRWTPNGARPTWKRRGADMRRAAAAQGRRPRSSTRGRRAGRGVPIWAMMETPRGILNAAGHRGASAPGGFVAGTNDLAKELGCAMRADRLPMLTGACSTCSWRRGRGQGLRGRRLQRLPGRGRAARRVRAGPRHGLRRQDADPSRAGGHRQRCLRPGRGRDRPARRQIAAFGTPRRRRGRGRAGRPDRREPARRNRPRMLAKAEAIAALAH